MKVPVDIDYCTTHRGLRFQSDQSIRCSQVRDASRVLDECVLMPLVYVDDAIVEARNMRDEVVATWPRNEVEVVGEVSTLAPQFTEPPTRLDARTLVIGGNAVVLFEEERIPLTKLMQALDDSVKAAKAARGGTHRCACGRSFDTADALGEHIDNPRRHPMMRSHHG